MTPRARARLRALLAGTVCAGLSAALTGCMGDDPDAGTNGVGKLTAAQIEKKARSAARSAEAVRLSGTVVSKGQTYRLQMRLKNSGGHGEVSHKGKSSFELLRVGKDLYLKANEDFWARQGKGGKEPTKNDRRAARKLVGKYVKVPSQDPAYKQFSGFTDMKVLLDGLLALDGSREVGDHGEVGGMKTIRVEAGEGNGGTVDVALHGTPYPLKLQRGGDAGTVRLSAWNQSFELSAPKKEQVVDYGKKISADGS
nr:hypothetical protein [Streptomyces xiaopingdaonensis]